MQRTALRKAETERDTLKDLVRDAVHVLQSAPEFRSRLIQLKPNKIDKIQDRVAEQVSPDGSQPLAALVESLGSVLRTSLTCEASLKCSRSHEAAAM